MDLPFHQILLFVIVHWSLNYEPIEAVSIHNNTIVCNEDSDPYCYWNTDLSCIDNIGKCNISCTAYRACYGSAISCGKGNQCNIICDGSQSCDYATLNCADDASCNIECKEDSCDYATINCPENNDCSVVSAGSSSGLIHCPTNGNCFIDFHCFPDPGVCSRHTINCPQNGNCEILCGRSSCEYSVINCPVNGNCHIWCNYHGCAYSSVLCPPNGECVIHCWRWYSCYDMVVDGSETSQLSIIGCHDIQSYSVCKGMVIWCPPNINGDKKCLIQG
eukprot:709161_1